MKRLTAGLLLVALAAGGCSNDTSTVRVLAASSLTDVFTDIAADFEATHPDLTVELVFAGSSSLVTQIEEGAGTGVIAVADRPTLQRALASGDVGEPVDFATNTARLLTTPALADVPIHELSIAVCAVEVPCGRAAEELFAQLGVDVDPVTFEANVSAVLNKLALGEVDAGVVYSTDAYRTDVVLVPHRGADTAGVTNRYAAAPYGEVEVGDTASELLFLAFLMSDDAQRRLGEAGFGPP